MSLLVIINVYTLCSDRLNKLMLSMLIYLLVLPLLLVSLLALFYLFYFSVLANFSVNNENNFFCLKVRTLGMFFSSNPQPLALASHRLRSTKVS